MSWLKDELTRGRVNQKGDELIKRRVNQGMNWLEILPPYAYLSV